MLLGRFQKENQSLRKASPSRRTDIALSAPSLILQETRHPKCSWAHALRIGTWVVDARASFKCRPTPGSYCVRTSSAKICPFHLAVLLKKIRRFTDNNYEMTTVTHNTLNEQRSLVYTGYDVVNGFIWGPRSQGEYWVEAGYIFGPGDATSYVVRGGRIYGPSDSGRFLIDGNSIYGPRKGLPWLH